jgi:hypothetical protein
MTNKKDTQLEIDLNQDFELPKAMQSNPDEQINFLNIGEGLRDKQRKYDEGDPRGVNVKDKIKNLRSILKKNS